MTSLFDKYLEQNDAFAGRGKPELSKAHKALKIVLVVVNVVFLVFGCVLMGVGSYAYNNNNLGALTGATLPLGIVTLGVFIMFVSFLGCFSAWKESRVLLGFYFFFLALMTFLLLVVGIAVDVKKNSAGSYIRSGWISASNDVRGGLQQLFQCCGLDGFNDTYAVQPCPTAAGSNVPCAPTMESEFYQQFNTVGTVGIVFAVLMTVFLAFVCCLIRGIHAKNMKADVGGLNPGDDSANPTTLDSPGATASAAAASPPPVSNV